MNKRHCRLSSCELVTLVTAIACNIANCYSEEEVELFAVVFAQLGDTLATIQVREAALSANNSEEQEEEPSCDDTDEDSSDDSDNNSNKGTSNNSNNDTNKNIKNNSSGITPDKCSE